MLEVVEHQEGALLAEVGAQSVTRTLPLHFPQTQRSGDSGNHERWIPKRGQCNEGHPVGEVARSLSRRRDGEASLAHSSDAGERQQSYLGVTQEELSYLCELLLAAQKRRRRAW